MNTVDILKVIRQDQPLSKHCFGVFASDTFPKRYVPFSCFVCNLDKISKPGSHWVAIYICSDGSCEYFDSYGRKPNKKIFKKITKINKKTLQGFSTCCGQYCLYYLLFRCRGYSMNQICDQFGNNQSENDSKVVDFINNNFNIDTETLDFEFAVSQLATSRSFSS